MERGLELPPEVPADPNAVDLAGAAALYEYHCQDAIEQSDVESANPDDLFIYQVSVARNGGVLVRDDPNSGLDEVNFVHVAVANLGADRNVNDWGVRVVGAGDPPMLYNPEVDEALPGDDVDLWAQAWLVDFEAGPEDVYVDPCGHKVLRLALRLDPATEGLTTPVEVSLVNWGEHSHEIHHTVTVDLPVGD